MRTRRALGWLVVAMLLAAGCTGCTGDTAAPAGTALDSLLAQSAGPAPGDPRAVELIEAIVRQADAAGELSPAQRAAVADHLIPYLADVNNALVDGEAGLPAQHGAWSRPDDAGADLAAGRQLRRVLAELGRDASATQAILVAQLDHFRDALRHQLSSGEAPLAGIRHAATGHAEVVTAVAGGALSDDATVANAAALHAGLTSHQRAAGALVGDGDRGDDPSLGLEPLFDQHRDTTIGQLDPGVRDRIIGALREQGRSAIEDLVSTAIYAAVPVGDPRHEELLPGLPAPLREAKQQQRGWQPPDWTLWYGYLDQVPALAAVVSGAASDYLARFPRH